MVKASKPAKNLSPAARAARQRLVQQRPTPERQALSEELVRKAHTLALRRAIKERLKVERENVRLAEQLERAILRSDLRLGEIAARIVDRARMAVRRETDRKLAQDRARTESRRQPINPTAVDDNYAQPEAAAAVE